MEEEKVAIIKEAVLAHMQRLFEEMEEEMAISHQEKYTLLEDALEQASDEAELKVAFTQWYGEHTEELGFEYDVSELWAEAIGEEYERFESEEE